MSDAQLGNLVDGVSAIIPALNQLEEERPITATLGTMRAVLLMLLLLPPLVFGADMLTPAYYDGGALSRDAEALLLSRDTTNT